MLGVGGAQILAGGHVCGHMDTITCCSDYVIPPVGPLDADNPTFLWPHRLWTLYTHKRKENAVHAGYCITYYYIKDCLPDSFGGADDDHWPYPLLFRVIHSFVPDG